MLTSDKLILVELHKAGSARLKKLLGDLVGGETSAKHASYSDELAALGKPVVGYVCNPLTWYLAQWKLGCAGKGDIHKRLTDETRWDLLRSKRASRPAKEGAKPDAKAIPEGWGAERAKTFWYADAANPEAFREWLQAVAASRGLRRLIDHGYANSPVSRLAGLMTYHFFIAFVRNAENMEKSVDSMEALRALHAEQAITSRFIRAESAGADLVKIIDALDVGLDDEQRAAVEGLKRRPGADEVAILHYYDRASLRLIAKREAFVNELFGYGPPDGEESVGEAKAGKTKKTQGEGPKLSKAEKEQRRQARSEKKAAKAAKAAARGEKKAAKMNHAPAGGAEGVPVEPGAAQPAKAGKVGKAAKPTKPGKVARAKAAKPQKARRAKKQPAGGDAPDSGE